MSCNPITFLFFHTDIANLVTNQPVLALELQRALGFAVCEADRQATMNHSRRANMEFLDEARDKFKEVVIPQKKATPFAAMLARRKAAESDNGKKGQGQGGGGQGGGVHNHDKHDDVVASTTAASKSTGSKERLSVRIKALAAQRHFSVVDHSRRPSAAMYSSTNPTGISLKAIARRNSTISGQPPQPATTEKTTGQNTNKSTKGNTVLSSSQPVPPSSSSSMPLSPSKSVKIHRQGSIYRPSMVDRSSLLFQSTAGALLPEERLDHVDRLIWLGLTHQIDNNDELHRKSAPTVANRFLRMSGGGGQKNSSNHHRVHAAISLDRRNIADEDDSNQKDNHYKVKGKGGGRMRGLSHLSRWAKTFHNQRTNTEIVNNKGGHSGGSTLAQSSCLPFLNSSSSSDMKVVPTIGGNGTSPHPLHPRPTTDIKNDRGHDDVGISDDRGRDPSSHSDDPYYHSHPPNEPLLHNGSAGGGGNNNESNNQSWSTLSNAGRLGLS